VSLDPLHHLSDKRTAWLLLVRIIPKYIIILLLSCDLDDCLNERGLAKVECTLALRAIAR
jgi:hypothetical protein